MNRQKHVIGSDTENKQVMLKHNYKLIFSALLVETKIKQETDKKKVQQKDIGAYNELFQS